MNLIKVVDGVAIDYTISKLKKDNPNVSFPKVISEDTLAYYGVHKYIDNELVDYDETTNVLESSYSVEDGVWSKDYEAVAISTELAEKNIKSIRTSLLKDTDWMAMSDVTLPTEWATYRQALRDITEQRGYPYTVSYPTKP